MTRFLIKLPFLCSYRYSFFVTIFLLVLVSPTNAQDKIKHISSMRQLEQVFKTAPDSIQTTVYWYWLYNSISREGVIKDLEAMKKVGINRAFIGNIAFPDVYNGKVKLFSEEWWDILHTALKTATRLGIEIGIFNSPGWSQSGGPWVKPEQAMRYLTSSETLVAGPSIFHHKLAKPADAFQDVKVIAYPVIKGVKDHVKKKMLELPKGESVAVDFQLKRRFAIRSLTIYPTAVSILLRGKIQAKVNGVYQTLKTFVVDRSNNEMNFGFKQYGPAAISIPETLATEYRVIFRNVNEKVTLSELRLSSLPVVESYIEKTMAKMWQDPFPYWPAYQWPNQPVVTDQSYVINPRNVVDLSSYLSADGTLNWKVPAGDWIIERCGMTPTQVKNSPASPEATGLETDKMSKKHIESHFNAFLGEIIRRIPAEDRKTWKVAVVDSYEAGGQNWSDGLIEKFKIAYGYDPAPYLPVMQGKVVGSTDESDRFLWDLRRYVADQLAYEYVAGLRNVSHQNGLTTWLENYGHSGFPGEFLQYGGQSDEVSGEFWTESNLGLIENRAASSCAHTYGKNKVSSESFTAGGYSYTRYPALMKQRLDKYLTEGINNTLLHVYIQQPNDRAPGLNGWFGNEFNRLNTWFFDMDLFIKYIKRCNTMLQQGKYVADVAYFISEDSPKMTGSQDPILPNGYSFDYINAEVIKERITVKDGRLVLPDGMNYKILVLPKLETMRPEFLRRIKVLVNQGAVVLGPRPSRSPSLMNYGKADLEVKQLAKELWGKIDGKAIRVNRYGQGMVIDGMNLGDALRLFKVRPDFQSVPSDSVLFIHREMQEGSLYFITNQKNETVSFQPTFRISGEAPELWDATTGKTRDLSDYKLTDSTTSIPLVLASYESAFIVFRKSQQKEISVRSNYLKLVKSIDLSNDWIVNFDSNRRGPAKPIVFKNLTDWTLNANDSIKYYSGAANYHHSFSGVSTKVHRVYLNLGKVTALAKVKVNGQDVGGVWTAPYKVDITDAIKAGKNSVEIKVINNWMNRIIGDSKLPEKERKTWLIYNRYNPDSPLMPSGLLGPVKLEIFDQ